MWDLLEKLMRVFDGDADWYSWWITNDGLIEVGHEQSGGDHYATLYIAEDPAIFGLSHDEAHRAQEMWDDEYPEDPEEWNDIVRKVLSSNIRLGVHRGELYVDLPTDDDKWLHLVQSHRGGIEKTKPNHVTIQISSTLGDPTVVNYTAVPVDDFWAADKLRDLGAYKNV